MSARATHGRGPLPEPDLVWRDGAPAAAGFDDIYFNPGDGLAEARHVFLAGTGLPQRWEGQRHATIGELGFGTGLNFLAAWELWNRTRPPGGRLHFVSVEGRPLTADQLSSVHDGFPGLAPLAERLRQVYPPRACGRHLLHLTDDVTLHLLFGEAGSMLAGLEAKIQTWFLDGFAPSKNPQMWRPDLMAEVARCSAPGARAATFSVAGAVRRALENAGFAIEKAPGFGRKREMLKARLERPYKTDSEPWFAVPPAGKAGRVAVIGGGIAGVSCARALKRQGCEVTVFEAGAGPGSGASGTPAGLVMSRLSAEDDAPARLLAEAHRFAVARYAAASALSNDGALHLPPRSDQAERLEKTMQTGLFDCARLELLDPAEASARAGTRVTAPALFFADAGQMDASRFFGSVPRELDLRQDTTVQRIDRHDEGWRLIGEGGEVIAPADTVVLASAMTAAALYPNAGWPLEARHGQITRITGAFLRMPVAYGGYAAPAVDGLWLGATHTKVEGAADPGIDPLADESNLAGARAVMPALLREAKVTGRWTGNRATTPDRLPLAGPVMSAAAGRAAFAPLGQGVRDGLPVPPYEPGLFVIAGLGSRGFVTAPLLGEAVAAQILGTPLPVDREARHAIHPARFVVRALRRGRG